MNFTYLPHATCCFYIKDFGASHQTDPLRNMLHCLPRRYKPQPPSPNCPRHTTMATTTLVRYKLPRMGATSCPRQHITMHRSAKACAPYALRHANIIYLSAAKPWSPLGRIPRQPACCSWDTHEMDVRGMVLAVSNRRFSSAHRLRSVCRNPLNHNPIQIVCRRVIVSRAQTTGNHEHPNEGCRNHLGHLP